MNRSALAAFTLASAMLATACADSIEPEVVDGGPGAGGKVRVADNEDGSHTVQVNANDPEEWIYVSLDQLRHMEPQEPGTSVEWDLALQRFHYALNGGVTGSGLGELSIVEDAFLFDVNLAPESGWSTDAPDSTADENSLPDYAFETAGDGWYDYDGTGHILTPKRRVYVVRGAEGELFAIQILSYYSDVGSSGWPKFTVKPL
jgi:hypothetical protein